MLSKLYALTLFLRTSAHWARMLSGLPKVLEQHVVVKPVASFGAPPPEAQEYADEVCSYMIAHYKRFARISDSTHVQHHWVQASEDDGYESDAGEVVVSEMDDDQVCLSFHCKAFTNKGQRGADAGVEYLPLQQQ